VFNADNKQTSILRNGHSVRILIDFHAYEPVPASIFVINICALDTVFPFQFSAETLTAPIEIPGGVVRVGDEIEVLEGIGRFSLSDD